VQHVRSRREQRAGPATAQTDLIYIGVVLKVAQAMGSYPVDPNIAVDACKACRRLHLIGESRRRDIRPDETQLVALTRYFLSRPRNVVIPMADIMWFAIYSARREGEICRLRWADNNSRTRTGLVRDLKHPTHKIGNQRRFRYTQEGWQIVMRQPQAAEFIFPYGETSSNHLATGR
jgi:integrase